jgi:hypothetical protein
MDQDIDFYVGGGYINFFNHSGSYLFDEDSRENDLLFPFEVSLSGENPNYNSEQEITQSTNTISENSSSDIAHSKSGKTKNIRKKEKTQKHRKTEASEDKEARQDNNSNKVVNPIFTTIWKEVLHRTGAVNFENGFEKEGITFKSLKSSKKYILVWMVLL